jgi:hypothetical protein
MEKAAQMRSLSGLRDTLHGPDAPPFMRNVMATGIGPKIVAGVPTDSLAIHFAVCEKLTLAELALSARVPARLAGYDTDVTDGSELLPREPPSLQSPSGCGYGTPLLTESGAWGTAACALRTAEGKQLLVTSAHVVDLGEVVYDGGQSPPLRLGRCSGRLPTASRHELYGHRGSATDGQHLVDVAVIVLDDGITLAEPALFPQPFSSDVDTASIDEWLFSSTPLLAWGAASRVWRKGAVVFYWPRRTQDDMYGLCLVQQEPGSEPGDSGSLWLAYLGGQYKALGLHWGLSTDQKAVMSFVTDGIAALGRLGVKRPGAR